MYKEYGIIFFALAPAIALLFEGIKRKLIARFQNRIGPPIVQPFYDFVKLWNKKESSAIGYRSVIFKLVPVLFLIAVWALFLFIPFPVISFEYDFIFVIYLTVLNSALFVLAPIASNSPLSTLGAMRECIMMVVYEITLAISIISLFVYSGAASFAALDQNLIVALPLAALCLLCVALVEIKITPFDTIEASAEIYSGPLTEFSGKELALLHLGDWMKTSFFAFLIAMLLGTKDIAIIFLAGLFLVALFAYLRATTSRYRLDQAFKFFMFVLILSLVNFIYAFVVRR